MCSVSSIFSAVVCEIVLSFEIVSSFFLVKICRTSFLRSFVGVANSTISQAVVNKQFLAPKNEEGACERYGVHEGGFD